MIKYINIHICIYINICSLLDNTPNYLVGCVIQKRIPYFCFLQDGNKLDICADSGLPYGECHKGEKLEHDMEQILKSIPKGKYVKNKLPSFCYVKGNISLKELLHYEFVSFNSTEKRTSFEEISLLWHPLNSMNKQLVGGL